MVDVRIDRCRTFWTPTESVATKPLCMDLVTNAPAGASIRCYAVHDANKQQKSAKGKRLRRPTAILKHLRGLTSRGARSGMPRRSGNCHVSALIAGSTLVAGYRYAPFGAVVQAVGVCAAMNPFRFSSEYADDELGLVYYNYRHYNPRDGRWVNRDPIEEKGGLNFYGMIRNQMLIKTDHNGLACGSKNNDWAIPEAPLGFDFTKPCEAHDRCYGAACRTKTARSTCDQNFLNNMKSVCSKQPDTITDICPTVYGGYFLCEKHPKKACESLASIYYEVVVVKGEDPYLKAWEDCCKDRNSKTYIGPPRK